MNPSSSISYEIAQARSADFRQHARREAMARTARPEPRPSRFRIAVSLRLRAARRRRVTAAIS